MNSIRYISRPEAFALSPALASYIADWQQQSFVLEDHLVEEGESIWLETDDDEPTVLTAAQAEECNADTRAWFDRNLDPFDGTTEPLPREPEIIAEPDCKSMRGVAGAMNRHMTRLAAELGSTELIVMPMVRASILEQRNDYPPVAKATSLLESKGFSRTDTEAAIAPTEVMAELIGSLFWIARCNASAPCIAIGAPGAPMAGVLCKYANIHFSAQADRQDLTQALERAGFHIPEDGMCQERFSGGSGMAGRRVDV